MMDANQVWDVNETIEHMKQLSHFKPYWIEEPTSPDDVLGIPCLQLLLYKYTTHHIIGKCEKVYKYYFRSTNVCILQ